MGWLGGLFICLFISLFVRLFVCLLVSVDLCGRYLRESSRVFEEGEARTIMEQVGRQASTTCSVQQIPLLLQTLHSPIWWMAQLAPPRARYEPAPLVDLPWWVHTGFRGCLTSSTWPPPYLL